MSDNQEVLHHFKCSFSSCKFILSNGKHVNFVAGNYYTSLDSEVAELKDQIKQGHPHISYAGETSKDELNPVAVIEKRAIERFIKENNLRDMGTTTKASPLIASAATSSDVANAAGTARKITVNLPKN